MEIEPAPAKVRLKREGRLVVAVPEEGLSRLTAEMVERAREELLEGRAASE